MLQEQRELLSAALMLRSSALRLPKSQTNVLYQPSGQFPLDISWGCQSSFVNPAQGIPPIVSKIMFAFWCLTVELCSAHVFSFFSETEDLEAWALFSFFRIFPSVFSNFKVLWLHLGESSVTVGLQTNLQECLLPRTAPPFAAHKVFSEEM